MFLGKRLRRVRNCAAILLLCLAFRPCQAASLRWAILGDAGSRPQKIADLVFARLSANEDIELVERDLLSEIARERELSLVFRAESVAGRVNLLELMKADRLVCLSERSDGSPPTLRVVIAESAQGARLAARDYPMESEQAVVGQVVALIHRCSRQYAQGVKAVVGVAPFTPDNLEHDYDSLSTAYRDLLQGKLSLLPGVAVIEMDEARAIAAEIAIGGSKVKSRITPILIDGHYKVVQDGAGVAFGIRATQGETIVVSVQETVARVDVPSFFSKQLLTPALKEHVERTRVPVDDQFRWLVTQAESFSRLALPVQSAGLREAALLLKPDHVQERLSLLADYRKIFGRRGYLSKQDVREYSEAAYNDVVARHVETYVSALHHVEYLIMNRMIDREVAADLIAKHAAKTLISPFPYNYSGGVNGEPLKRRSAEILIQAEDAELAMHKLVMPVFYSLPGPNPNRGLGLANFDQYLMLSYLTRVDSAGPTPKQLEECLYFFNELCPEDRRTTYELQHFFGRGRPEIDRFAQITSDEWLAFLDELSQSKKALVRAMAEYGRIKAALWRQEGLESHREGLAARVKTLMATWQTLPVKQSRRRNGEPIFRDLKRLDEKLAPHEKVVTPKRTYPTKPDTWQTDPSTWRYSGYPEMLGHLRFKQLGVTMEGEHGTTAYPPKLSFTQGNKDVDFLWNQTGVWRLDAELRMCRVAEDAADPVKNVLWDGTHLWILSGEDYAKGEHSLAVYDAEGRRLAGLDADDFSRHDKTMRMIVIETGTVCVTGTFFPHDRTWLAMVSLVDGELELNEFHRATEVPTIQKDKRSYGNPNLVFVPRWMHVLNREEGQSPLLLIGRDRTTTYERFHPLAIDTETLEVTVHPYGLGNRGLDKSFFSVNGEILCDTEFKVTHWARPGEKWDNGKEWMHRCENMHNAVHLGDGFFLHGGFLHVTGRKWFRINLETMEEEEMTRGLVPRKWRMQWYGSSANHGLIGFNGKFYSISFADEHLFTQD